MVRTIPEDIEFLRTPSEPVKITDDYISIINELLSEVDQIGCGLAAIQIGYLKAITVMQLGGPTESYTVAINPIWTNSTHEKTTRAERCLSIPSGTFKVIRYEAIMIAYLDKDFKPQSKKLYGFAASIYQHETDHTKGRIISDTGILIS